MLITDIKKALAANHLCGAELPGAEGQNCLALSPAGLSVIAAALRDVPGTSLIDIWAAEGWQNREFTVFYAFEAPGEPVAVIAVALPGNEATSVSQDFPVATYLERLVRDGFGTEFTGAFDTRRLALHEAYPDGFHPMPKSFQGKVPPGRAAQAYPFKHIEGEGVYQIPVGPVHAGIIEPGHFRFSVIGETIFNLEIRHFYKYRGLEKIAEGMTLAEGIRVAETISGDESAANACGYALAAERLSEAAAPRRAWQLRTVLLEMERVYSHLGDLAGMAVDVAYPLGAAPFFVLREEMLRWNARLTGSRFLKGIIVPGGLSRDISGNDLAAFAGYCLGFMPLLDKALKTIYGSAWVVDRFETTGVVKKEFIRPFNLSGPTARASGSVNDTRADHHYGLYGEIIPEVKTLEAGDVLARFQLKAAEIKESVRIILAAAALDTPGPVCVPCPDKSGCALALIESARGQSLHWIYAREGRIERYHARTASFCNWLAIEPAVLGNIVPDFPLINKSLNLSYAGNDL
jgi:formate hydrogenlyase subunit 5